MGKLVLINANLDIKQVLQVFLVPFFITVISWYNLKNEQ